MNDPKTQPGTARATRASVGLRVTHRRYVPYSHAHYAGNLVDGAYSLAAFGDVANRRRVPYVDCFTPLVAHEQWLADLATGDGLLPGQAGYGLIAWLVLHTGWHVWLGLPEDL